MAFCTKCGKELTENDNFCPSCGEPVADKDTKTENNAQNDFVQSFNEFTEPPNLTVRIFRTTRYTQYWRI